MVFPEPEKDRLTQSIDVDELSDERQRRAIGAGCTFLPTGCHIKGWPKSLRIWEGSNQTGWLESCTRNKAARAKARKLRSTI